MADSSTPASMPTQPSLSELHDKLDKLWEQHLHLLDAYDVAQKQLQKHMSSGFFSLAQATFKSPTRQRYGQDYYDERMQATRRLSISFDAKGQLKLKVRHAKEGKEGDEKEEAEGEGVRKQEMVRGQEKEVMEGGAEDAKIGDGQLPTPPGTPYHTISEDVDGEETIEPDANKEDGEICTEKEDDVPSKDGTKIPKDQPQDQQKPKQPTNPVNWFGILVPSQLRQAQKSFISAVEDVVGDAAGAAQDMKRVEVEIRKLRKEIRKAEKKEIVNVE